MAGACNYDIGSFKTRWYFDQPDGRCEMFWYYPNCVKSQNIFETKYVSIVVVVVAFFHFNFYFNLFNLFRSICEQTCSQFFNTTTPIFYEDIN